MTPPWSPSVFGPVPSRRLGRSLGVDMVPPKTCTFDCRYCQLGPTTHLTSERRRYGPVDAVVAAVTERLADDCCPDVVTLGGSGEPTLSLDLGAVLERLSPVVEAPLAVLTNGSLLSREDVRRELAHADIVLPSLDAGSEATFMAINRPCRAIDFATHVDGLQTFSAEYRGEIWLEIMLVAGMNDDDRSVDDLAELVERMSPSRVQLNTGVRPPADGACSPLTPERMAAVASRFHRPVDVVQDGGPWLGPQKRQATEHDVLALLHRRPCSAADVAHGLSLHPAVALELLETLHAEGRVVAVPMADHLCYCPATRAK